VVRVRLGSALIVHLVYTGISPDGKSLKERRRNEAGIPLPVPGDSMIK
jgi:hypothetical protein